jgi:hypothetical protein
VRASDREENNSVPRLNIKIAPTEVRASDREENNR